METLISWVVCTTLFLLLLYSIVGTTITLRNCVDIISARQDIITLSTVVFSSVYSSAIRLLFFSVLQHRCFLHSSPSVCSVWVVFGLSFALQSLAVHVHSLSFVWAGSACLLSGNFLNLGNEIRNRKPETTDQRKQALQIRGKLFCRSFALESKRPSKKVLKQKFLVCRNL